jgi:hypothetical protein
MTTKDQKRVRKDARMPTKTKTKTETTEKPKTKTETETDSVTDSATDAANKVIADVETPKRGRGRPPGSKNKQKEGVTAPIVVTEGDIAAAGAFGAVIFDIIGPFAKLAPITETQKQRLGGALAPLMQKWMPILADWQYEFNAIMVVSAIVIEARRSYVPPPPEDIEGSPDDNSNPR